MISRIRVLHLIETLGRGGAEGLLYTNLSKFNRGRFDSIVCHLYDRDLHWRQPILDLGYPVFSLGMTSLRDASQALSRLSRLLGREPVHLIHTHLYSANILGRIAGWLKNVPVISSLHNPDYDPVLLRDNPALSPAKLCVIRLLDRLSSLLANPDFLAVSEYVRFSAIQHLRLSPDRVGVIYNSVDVSYLDHTPISTAELRTQLRIPPDNHIVLSVARYDPQKGLKYLIESLPLLARQFPNIAMVLVGGGSEAARRSHQDLAERLGVISQCRCLGMQTDIRPYLRLCDIFVLPSLFEGFGIALVEAMAMGRVCVATKVSALPEVVADGRSGLLVEPADPPALAKAIARLIEDHDLRAKMGAEGRRIVLERFNINRNIHQLETLYEQVSRKTRAHPS